MLVKKSEVIFATAATQASELIIIVNCPEQRFRHHATGIDAMTRGDLGKPLKNDRALSSLITADSSRYFARPLGAERECRRSADRLAAA